MQKTAAQLSNEILKKLSFQGRMGFESSRAGNAVVPPIREMLSASRPQSFKQTAMSVPLPPKPELPKPTKPPPVPPPPKVQVAQQSEIKPPKTKPLLSGRMGT
jgi:hypothetical protein